MTADRLPEPGPARAHHLIDRFDACRIAVVGDVMLDWFLIGRVNRISPEAPVPVVVFDHEEHRLGGAANVAHNLRALGAAVDLIGVVGADDAGTVLRAELAAADVAASGLIADPGRRTTTKLRVVTSRNQQVARVDYEADHDVPAAIEDALVAQIEARATAAQVILVSDYQKGAITRSLMRRIVAFGRAQGVPVIVDPKVAHIDYYAGVTVLTPNHFEAESATHVRILNDDDARRAADVLRQRLGIDSVLITRGEHGMWLSHAGAGGSLPAAAREVADVTGAGDTVVATLALVVAAGGSLAEAVCLANQAASIVVGKFGAATVTAAELRARFQA